MPNATTPRTGEDLRTTLRTLNDPQLLDIWTELHLMNTQAQGRITLPAFLGDVFVQLVDDGADTAAMERSVLEELNLRGLRRVLRAPL